MFDPPSYFRSINLLPDSVHSLLLNEQRIVIASVFATILSTTRSDLNCEFQWRFYAGASKVISLPSHLFSHCTHTRGSIFSPTSYAKCLYLKESQSKTARIMDAKTHATVKTKFRHFVYFFFELFLRFISFQNPILTRFTKHIISQSYHFCRTKIKTLTWKMCFERKLLNFMSTLNIFCIGLFYAQNLRAKFIYRHCENDFPRQCLISAFIYFAVSKPRATLLYQLYAKLDDKSVLFNE